MVGRFFPPHHALCRKYRECRKIPSGACSAGTGGYFPVFPVFPAESVVWREKSNHQPLGVRAPASGRTEAPFAWCAWCKATAITHYNLSYQQRQAAARSDRPGNDAAGPSVSVQAAAPADAKGRFAAHLSCRVETAGIVLPPGRNVVTAADEDGNERTKTSPARQASGVSGRQGFLL